MKQLKISAFVLALVALAPLAAFAQSVSGDWDVTLETPQGAYTVTLKLAQIGSTLTGTMSSPMGDVALKGTATGADMTAVGDMAGAMTLTFAGKLAGDTLNGTVKLGAFGEGGFTGKRAGARTAVAPVASPADPATRADSISGKWNVVTSLPGLGDIPLTATIMQAGDKVSGMIDSEVGGNVAVAGTITGNALKLSFTATTANGDIPVEMTGTLAAGALSGKASIVGVGEADWTGKRAQ